MLIAAGGWCAPSETFYDLTGYVCEIDWDEVDLTRAAHAAATGELLPVPEPESLIDSMMRVMLEPIRVMRGCIRFPGEDG